jgi:hypothetical protein
LNLLAKQIPGQINVKGILECDTVFIVAIYRRLEGICCFILQDSFMIEKHIMPERRQMTARIHGVTYIYSTTLKRSASSIPDGVIGIFH